MTAVVNWAQEAEQSLIGALLLDCQRAFDRAQPIAADDFYDDRHGMIFRAIEKLHGRRQPVDVVTVYQELKDSGLADTCGGLVYLGELVAAVPSASGASRYGQIVRDKARLRALINATEQAQDIASAHGEMSQKVDRITSLFLGIQKDQIARVPRSLAQIAIERTQYYEDLEAGRVNAGWPTHIPTLDRMLNGGLRPGALYILAARPSVGKSSLAQTLGMEQAKAGRKVLFLSQEMAAEELADRGVSSAGRIDYGALMTGRLDREDWSRAADVLALQELENFHVDDQPALTLMDVRAKAKQIPGLSLLILDYLQLCSGKGDNRNAEIEQISRGLKALAKELNIAVVALSQLNRQVEQRPGKRPVLSDLRDSGSIEQDADVVMFLWPVRDIGENTRLLGLAIEKNRQGRCGHVALHFEGKFQRWAESLESIDQQPVRVSRGFMD